LKDNINIDQNRSLVLEIDVTIPGSHRLAGFGIHGGDDDPSALAAKHLIEIVIQFSWLRHNSKAEGQGLSSR
jgi:hypothetical protein